MDVEIKEKIKQIAHFTKEQIGESEESVKINFVVPLLEYFGHKRMNFEYKFKDIYIKKGLPRTSRVIIETKKYGKPLDKELAQLERYCNEERPLLGLIVNGDEILVFSYYWKFRPFFKDTLIYRIARKDLDKDEVIESLSKILSRENLESGKSKKNLVLREKEIERVENKISETSKEFQNKENTIQNALNELISKSKTIQIQIDEYQSKIKQIQVERKERVSEIWNSVGIRSIKVKNVTPSPTSPASKIKQTDEPPYIKKYRATLVNPNSLPNKIKDYIQENKGITFKDLKRICVDKFGCKSETSGSIGASIKMLETDGYIKIEGKGDSKTLYPTDK